MFSSFRTGALSARAVTSSRLIGPSELMPAAAAANSLSSSSAETMLSTLSVLSP